ncbi:MAG: YkgJ family cysteine cluster protein [Chitinophagaceae bacterium]
MIKIEPVNFRSFRKKVRNTKNSFRRFLTKLEKSTLRSFDGYVASVEKKVWEEVDCLSCANCCKTMTPTFNPKDLKRISAHFGQTVDEFKAKWLFQERGAAKDWMNKTEPCQFLNLKDNKCSIYAIRPDDCAGFPHLSKKFKEYAHVHKQNVEYCPATYKLVEKMMDDMRKGNGNYKISVIK